MKFGTIVRKPKGKRVRNIMKRKNNLKEREKKRSLVNFRK